MRRMILSILATIVLLTGCSAGKDIELAQTEVARFHKMLDAGQFAEIYASTGTEIRQDMTEAEWAAFLSSIHQGLGTVTRANATGWNVDYDTDGGTVELVYDTQFTRGTGQETFIYKMADSKATLAGYHIKTK